MYYLSDKRITDQETLKRVKHLAIPPAWEDVHVSSAPNTHIQAYGFDAKGRKQYLYHPEWIVLQQQHKFDKMIFFGTVLPEIRKKVYADLNLRALAKERVLATIIWLLEHTLIRVGNERYAVDNKSYGLTTIQNKHVDVHGDHVTFEFKGKSGVYHTVHISDRRVARVIYRCQELPEQELFEYTDESKVRHDVSAGDVNEYLKKITGEEISAKDFRTWGGTVSAGELLHEKGDFQTIREFQKNISSTVKTVSRHLRNTAAICRAYYIHPKIISSYEKKILIPHFNEVYKHIRPNNHLHKDEYATWTLLKETK
jgi:DNA topoisomerase-1